MEAEKREQRRVDKKIITMQCGCVMYVDRAASTSINELTEHKPFIITIIVLDDLDHHTGLRGIARERERERERGEIERERGEREGERGERGRESERERGRERGEREREREGERGEREKE